MITDLLDQCTRKHLNSIGRDLLIPIAIYRKKSDLIQAIRKKRQTITHLNKENRK